MRRRPPPTSYITNHHLILSPFLLTQDTQIWVVYKTDKEEASAYISACAGIAALAAALLQPFMPSFTVKLLAQLGLSEVKGSQQTIDSMLP